MKRRLTLTFETLAELSTEDLSGIHGAQGAEAISLPHIVCVVTDLTKRTTCLNCE